MVLRFSLYLRLFHEFEKQFWFFVKNLRKDASGIQALKNHGVLVSDNKKAKLLNARSKSVFTMSALPDFDSKHTSSILMILSLQPKVWKNCSKIGIPNKATGPDGISPRVLKEFASEIARWKQLYLLCNDRIYLKAADCPAVYFAGTGPCRHRLHFATKKR